MFDGQIIGAEIKVCQRNSEKILNFKPPKYWQTNTGNHDVIVDIPSKEKTPPRRWYSGKVE